MFFDKLTKLTGNIFINIFQVIYITVFSKLLECGFKRVKYYVVVFIVKLLQFHNTSIASIS